MRPTPIKTRKDAAATALTEIGATELLQLRRVGDLQPTWVGEARLPNGTTVLFSIDRFGTVHIHRSPADPFDGLA